jgi:homoserine acetyltransferase
LMSIENYKQIKKLQEFFEKLETQILLEQAIEIQNKLDENQMLTMEDVMNKHNISEEELKKAMESVEIE